MPVQAHVCAARAGVDLLTRVLAIELGGDGIARYLRSNDDPEVAEVAVTVIDDWQGRGLGRVLLTRLTLPPKRGIGARLARALREAAAGNLAPRVPDRCCDTTVVMTPRLRLVALLMFEEIGN